MPSQTVETHGDQVAAQHIRDLPPLITDAAHDSDGHRRGSEGAATRRNARAAQHPEFAQANLRAIVRHLFALAMIVTAGASDVLTFRPVGAYLGHIYADDITWISVLLQIVFPLGVLTAELYVAAQRVDADRRGFGARLGWNTAALLIVAVMPVLAVAAQLADDRARDSVFWLRLGAMATLTALLHAFIVFGGHAIHTAKAYLLFIVGDRYLAGIVRDDGADARRRAGEVFRDYHAALEQYNATHPNARISPAAFDEITRRVLEAAYGYAVIHTPGAPPANPTSAATVLPSQPGQPPAPQPYSPTPPPAPTDPGSAAGPLPADGETEYLRRVLDQRVREADAQVVHN